MTRWALVDREIQREIVCSGFLSSSQVKYLSGYFGPSGSFTCFVRLFQPMEPAEGSPESPC